MNGHVKSLIEFLEIIALAPIVHCLPCFRKKIVFGAWLGRQFSDNPKYFAKYLLEHTDYQCYWIGRPEVEAQVKNCPGIHFVRRGTLSAIWHLVTARWTVCNIHWDGDIMRFPTYGRSTNLNFWHGTALKKIGCEQYAGKGKRIGAPRCGGALDRIRRLKHQIEEWAMPSAAYTTCANKDMIDILHRSCPPRFVAERTLVAGQPRNDFLIQNVNNASLKQTLKEKYAKLLNIPSDKKWWLYMPTWRHGDGDVFSFLMSKHKEDYQRILKDQGVVLVEKQHPITLRLLNLMASHEGSIYTLASLDNSKLDMQELLLVSDRLITDYSSCFFDFEVIKRPTIHFAYDYETYAQQDTGVEYELADVAAGPIVKSEDELIEALRLSDADLWEKRGPLADETVSGEKGDASARFAQWMGMAVSARGLKDGIN